MKRITRISPSSAGKVGGILFLLLGFLASLGVVIWALASDKGSAGPGELAVAAAMILVFSPFIVAIYGIAFGLIGAWLYNVTVKFTGGLEIELEEKTA